jgi:hypothetical protein
MGEDLLQNEDWIYINSTFIHGWTGTSSTSLDEGRYASLGDTKGHKGTVL